MTDKDVSPQDLYRRMLRDNTEEFKAKYFKKPAKAETPLTKPPGHYLTGYEGSECERIEPEIIKWKEDSKPIIAMDFGKGDETVCVEVTARPDGEIESIRGIDTDEFKKQCEDIDNES